FAGFGFERAAALVAPEFLRFPQPPVAVIELLHEPGQPAGAGLGHHHLQFWVPLEDAPGEQIDKRLEKIVEEAFGVRKHAGCLAGGTVAWLHTKHRDVPGQDDAGLFERGPQRLPSWVVEFRVHLSAHQADLAYPTLLREAAQFG